MSTWPLVGVTLAACIALGACSPAPPVAPRPVNPDASGFNFEMPVRAFSVGDVESYTDVTLKPSPQSVDGTVVVTESMTVSNRLARVEVDVPATPDAFWLTFEIRYRGDIKGHTVLAKARIKVDDREIDSFSFVMAEDTVGDRQIHEYNLLEGLDQIPDTMLAVAELDLTLYPHMDEADFDIDNPPAPDPKEQVTKYSNPVRIRYGTEGGAP